MLVDHVVALSWFLRVHRVAMMERSWFITIPKTINWVVSSQFLMNHLLIVGSIHGVSVAWHHDHRLTLRFIVFVVGLIRKVSRYLSTKLGVGLAILLLDSYYHLI